MVDVNTPVRKGYFQRLNGAVMLDGQPVPVCDAFAPNTAKYPYIILSTQGDTGDSTKQSQSHEATLLVDIVTGFTGGATRTPVDLIAGQILSMINPADLPDQIDVGPDLQIISTRLLSDNTVTAQIGSYKIIRRLLRFGHNIHEQVKA